LVTGFVQIVYFAGKVGIANEKIAAKEKVLQALVVVVSGSSPDCTGWASCFGG